MPSKNDKKRPSQNEIKHQLSSNWSFYFLKEIESKLEIEIEKDKNFKTTPQLKQLSKSTIQ